MKSQEREGEKNDTYLFFSEILASIPTVSPNKADLTTQWPGASWSTERRHWCLCKLDRDQGGGRCGGSLRMSGLEVNHTLHWKSHGLTIAGTIKWHRFIFERALKKQTTAHFWETTWTEEREGGKTLNVVILSLENVNLESWNSWFNHEDGRHSNSPNVNPKHLDNTPGGWLAAYKLPLPLVGWCTLVGRFVFGKALFKIVTRWRNRGLNLVSQSCSQCKIFFWGGLFSGLHSDRKWRHVVSVIPVS